MPQVQSEKIAGGRYVCSRCDETFSSILELRTHERLCPNGVQRRQELRAAIVRPLVSESRHSTAREG